MSCHVYTNMKSDFSIHKLILFNQRVAESFKFAFAANRSQYPSCMSSLIACSVIDFITNAHQSHNYCLSQRAELSIRASSGSWTVVQAPGITWSLSSSSPLPLLHFLFSTSSSTLPLLYFLFSISSSLISLLHFLFSNTSSLLPLLHFLFSTAFSQLPLLHFLFSVSYSYSNQGTGFKKGGEGGGGASGRGTYRISIRKWASNKKFTIERQLWEKSKSWSWPHAPHPNIGECTRHPLAYVHQCMIHKPGAN